MPLKDGKLSWKGFFPDKAALTVELGALLDAVAAALDEIPDCPRALEVEGAAPRVVVLAAPELEQVELRHVALDDERAHLEHDCVHVLKLAAPVVPVRTAELQDLGGVVLRLVIVLGVDEVKRHCRFALNELDVGATREKGEVFLHCRVINARRILDKEMPVGLFDFPFDVVWVLALIASRPNIPVMQRRHADRQTKLIKLFAPVRR